MIRERELGSTRAEVKSGGSWVLPFDAYDSLSAAFRNGEAFWEGVTLYGARVLIRLGDLGGVVQNGPDHLAARLEESRADGKDDAIHE